MKFIFKILILIQVIMRITSFLHTSQSYIGRCSKRGYFNSVSKRSITRNGQSEFPVEVVIDNDAIKRLTDSISSIGNEIREIKKNNPLDSLLPSKIEELLQLKQQYKEATANSTVESPKIDTKKTSSPNTNAPKRNTDQQAQSSSSIITPRNEDYSQWYNDVITSAEMVDASPVRGCMVIRPWGMGVWDLLRSELDSRIRETGTENAYFPLFIPKSFLTKEAQHVEGFAKECAVVTHHRLKLSDDGKDLIPDPDALLEEPLIVRPTSETVIWNMFGKWISSYRDLPLKINQWANVVRWEMRTRPFLRSSEFLWQEGHTAHATADDAVSTATEILDLYESVCKDMLAIPTVKGIKSPSERFAGADETYTIEALMQNGWALQSGTSHFLGQNFARAFDVFYQTDSGSRELVWATSWGVSTRLIGAMVMSHSDDKGLVLPPPVAPLQVVVVPIAKGKGLDSSPEVMERANALVKALKSAGIRAKVDVRDNMRPGAKYFEWERKGLPIRLDVGPKDVVAGNAVMAVRFDGTKTTISTTSEEFVSTIKSKLENIHSDMLSAASERLSKKTFSIKSYDEMKALMQSSAHDENGKSTLGFYLVPWKCDAANEAAIKEECRATIRCYPLEFNKVKPVGEKCFYSGEEATHMAIFARAF